ncbi:7801_t:CDS:2, partial [Funneliformis geosporum]
NTIKALVGKAVETKLNELETINQELNQKKAAVKKVEDAIWHLQGVEREKAHAKDNIYKIKIGTAESETTEEQIINTVARTVKAFEKVDIADFTAKYNAKQSDATKRKKINDTLTYIQN